MYHYFGIYINLFFFPFIFFSTFKYLIAPLPLSPF